MKPIISIIRIIAMKRKFIFYFIIQIFFVIAGLSESVAQTVSTTVTYSGFLGCGGCVVCGTDYWCVNTPGSYCGNTPACDTKTFVDPVPPGSLVTSIHLDYYTASCYGSYINPSVDGTAFPTVYDGNTGCLCSASPCGLTGVSSYVFPCGFTGYNYGGINTLQVCTGTGVCFSHINLIITYVPGTPPSSSTYTWKGNTSNDWNTACNWDSNTVPTSAKDVIIPPGYTYYPIIYSGENAYCNTIQVQSSIGASMVIQTGGFLNITQ